MPSGKKPRRGELGGFTSADIAAAIAIESEDFLARVLLRLEARNGKKSRPLRADRAASPREEPILIETRPGDDFKIGIPWRNGGIRVFRRIAFFSMMVGGKCQRFGRWEGQCVQCGAPFFLETYAGIKTPKSMRFRVTTCPEHRKRNGDKSGVAPIVASDVHG